MSNNSVEVSDLPKLIHDVHRALIGIESEIGETGLREPTVPVKKSVTPDYVVCLEDGKKLKMPKRHLKTAYDMTPEQYRERWGFAPDYPMVAPNYAKHRSALAKKIGLGLQNRRRRK